MAGFWDMFQGPLLQQGGMFGGMPQGPMNLSPQALQANSGPLSGITNWIQQNPTTVLSLAAGLMSGKTTGEGFANGLQGILAGRPIDQKQMSQQALSKFIESQGALEPNTRELLRGNPELAQAYVQNLLSPATSEDIKEFKFAKSPEGGGFTGTFPEFLQQKRAATAGSGLGNTPIWMRDSAGNPAVGRLTPEGVGLAPTPEGYKPLGPYERGLETSASKITGQSYANLPSTLHALDRTIETVDSALQDPNLSSITGSVQGRLPRWTGAASEAQAKVDQVLGGTFLTAYNDLRGAGQITEQEGQAAMNAYNQLRTMTMTDAGYKSALATFKEELFRLKQIAVQRANNPAPSQGGAPAAAPQIRTFNPATGRLE